jgi:hypothetical protein
VPNYEQSAKIVLENHLSKIKKLGLQTTEPQKAQYNLQAAIKGLDGSIKLLVYFSNLIHNQTIVIHFCVFVVQPVYKRNHDFVVLIQIIREQV